jgi:hypothetical protein
MLFFFFGFPIYLFGLTANYLPYKLIDTLRYNVSKSAEYQGPVKLVLGAALYPVYYFFFFWYIVMIYPVGWLWLILLYAIACPLSGLFALHYRDSVVNLHGLYKTFSLLYRQNIQVATLISQRLHIMSILKTAQADYMTYKERHHVQ